METKDILKKLRKARGYTSAKDFCKDIGISFNTYQNYESGSRMPTADMLIKFADFYDVTTDYLLGRETTPNSLDALFATDSNISDESEEDVINKYMSLPPEARTFLMDMLIRMVDATKKRQKQMKSAKQGTVEETAKTKEEASS